MRQEVRGIRLRPDVTRRWRDVLTAIVACTSAGCSTWSPSPRSLASPAARAPDLFDLTGLTPPSEPGRLTPWGVSSWSEGQAIARTEPRSVDPSSGREPTKRPSPTPDGEIAPGRHDAPEPSPPIGRGGLGPSNSPPPAATAAATPSPIPLTDRPYPIDLSSALRLADTENPTIAEARVAILAALAQRQAAYALLLPSLNAGLNYHGHDGDLQRSSGRILRLSEQSFYVGGGARALAAESVAVPAVNVFSPLTDAIFEPLAARQRVYGARFNAAAIANTVLLEVASLYLELLRAEASVDSLRLSAAQADAIVKVVADYARAGQGRKADADRADADRRLLQGEIQRAEEEVAVASARLSRRLNLDATVRLKTTSSPLAPLRLIDASQPPEGLISAALRGRPDLFAQEALIAAAENLHKEEKARPLLPTVWLGFSGGGFGGGSNLAPPSLGNFAGRTDFDVRAYWTLLNLGAGNSALIKRRRAEVGEAVAERARVVNRVRSEVLSARAEALSQRQQVDVARTELASAEDGFRDDYERLRETIAEHPIEVLDSLRLLATARLRLITAITRSNQAQFALFVALGSPPPLDDSEPATSTPPPIGTPLRSPIVRPQDEATPPVLAPGPPLLGN